MQLYAVKLKPNHLAQKNQIYKGYLGDKRAKEIYCYERGWAQKKAIVFKGKIEKYGNNITVTEVKSVTLNINEFKTETMANLNVYGNYKQNVIELAIRASNLLKYSLVRDECRTELNVIRALVLKYDTVIFE